MTEFFAIGSFFIMIISMIIFVRGPFGFFTQLNLSLVQLAALVSFLAMVGSLYLSEILLFAPCKFCWIQRGFMYPIWFFLLIATRFPFFKLVAFLSASIGIGYSTYHIYVQNFPNSSSCGLVSCSAKWVNHFYNVSIPVMAFFMFASILLLLLKDFLLNRKSSVEI